RSYIVTVASVISFREMGSGQGNGTVIYINRIAVISQYHNRLERVDNPYHHEFGRGVPCNIGYGNIHRNFTRIASSHITYKPGNIYRTFTSITPSLITF